eukprot:TRINITY_DN33108_c0_g1_i1.p1 TRINITY_DN33108_c0_g1~~TRINITY_DN33108_c0_g1_i1.p1  ORF type:complete len:506 (+),score=112.81 TRINITY_DN33108_c0_g1_i1:132-1649(+)
MAINVEMPFEKARQQMAQWRNYAMPISVEEVDNEPPESPNVLVDAVSLGGSPDPKQKPLVRHVLVKDLYKIGLRLKYTFPKAGVFSDKAPMGLYALFDGQSCAGEPGPMAAEFCARNFHAKLLERLSGLPAAPDRDAVEGALRGTVEDLDEEIINNQPDVKDGCGAAIALLIGQHIFTAVLGGCAALLCDATGGPRWNPLALGGGQAQAENDFLRLRSAGGSVVNGPGGGACIQHPTGALSRVSRSLGDREWKGQNLVARTPEVQSLPLRRHDEHPSLLLVTSSVASSLGVRELVDIAESFPLQPRAACGEISSKALEARAGAAALAQCTTVEVFFLPERLRKEDKRRPESAPAYKKAKVSPGGGTQSVRLRHILLKYSDGPQSKDADRDGRLKKPQRSRQDAEAVLRKALVQLRKALLTCKHPNKPEELMQATSKKFAELCKEFSDCETARKGGATCGDLGWVTPEDRSRWGGTFKEVVDVLSPGQFSDIAVSDQGIHLVQRIA